MSTRPEWPVFRAWLPFFVVSTALTFGAALVASTALRDDPGEVPGFGEWLAGLLLPLPFTLLAFRWVVGKHFATPDHAGRARPPVFRPWLVYTVVSTVGQYFTSILVGALVGAIVLQAGTKPDFDDWRLLVVPVVFAMAPVSWMTFRWVVRRYYAAGAGVTPEPRSTER